MAYQHLTATYNADAVVVHFSACGERYENPPELHVSDITIEGVEICGVEFSMEEFALFPMSLRNALYEMHSEVEFE